MIVSLGIILGGLVWLVVTAGRIVLQVIVCLMLKLFR